jgi:hypothetical protein
MDQKRLLVLLNHLVKEAVGHSEAYGPREDIRAKIQVLVKAAVEAGEIQDQEDLDEWFKTATMSISALKMVPFHAWKKLR